MSDKRSEDENRAPRNLSSHYPDVEHSNSHPANLAQAITNQPAMEIPKSLLRESLFIMVICAAQFMTQVGLAIAIVPLHIIGDICRAFQGIGPAFLLPNALAILGCTYPPGPRKDMVFSIFGATAPGGFAVGGAFSALLAERAWWPWVYWIMAIFCFASAVFGTLVIPKSSSPKLADPTPWWIKCDLLGGLLGIAALVLINFAWNQGPSVGLSTVYVYVLLIVGFLCLALFLWIEFHATCPLLPREIFSEDVAWVLGCMAAGWSSFGVVVFYFFQFLEVIKGEPPLLALAKWAPSAVSGAIAAVTTGFILAHLRPSVIMLIAMLAFTAGQILLATLPVHQTYWAQAFVISILTPWGM
jgi:MFS family permease